MIQSPRLVAPLHTVWWLRIAFVLWFVGGAGGPARGSFGRLVVASPAAAARRVA